MFQIRAPQVQDVMAHCKCPGHICGLSGLGVCSISPNGPDLEIGGQDLQVEIEEPSSCGVLGEADRSAVSGWPWRLN